MIMMGYEFMHEKPFSYVYIHQLIRDKYGRKMSKSLGNGIDPIDMSEKYGTDPVRFTLAILAAQGVDIKLDEKYFDTYRKFANKIWNATRFVLMNLEGFEPIILNDLDTADRWVLSRLQKTVQTVTDALENFEFNVAAKALYDFFWDEFCDWYIECAKPRLLSEDRKIVQNVLVNILDVSFRLLHPFMPFLSEELWQKLPIAKESIVVASWPDVENQFLNDEAERSFVTIQQIVRGVRNIRAELNIPVKQAVELFVVGKQLSTEEELYVKHLAFVDRIIHTNTKPSKCATAYVSNELHVYVNVEGLNTEEETRRLQKNISKLEQDREWHRRKLSDENFLTRAPEDAINETKEKLAQIEKRLIILKQILEDLS